MREDRRRKRSWQLEVWQKKGATNYISAMQTHISQGVAKRYFSDLVSKWGTQHAQANTISSMNPSKGHKMLFLLRAANFFLSKGFSIWKYDLAKSFFDSLLWLHTWRLWFEQKNNIGWQCWLCDDDDGFLRYTHLMIMKIWPRKTSRLWAWLVESRLPLLWLWYIYYDSVSVCVSVTKNDHFLLGVFCNHS